MEDRVSLYPGRVKLEPVAGQTNVYDLTRADEPTQEGTPLSKASLLKDATAAQFGLENVVPDDIFSWLGKYNEHWWSVVYGGDYAIEIGSVQSLMYIVMSTLDDDPVIKYSNSVSVSATGTVVLDNPTTVTAESLISSGDASVLKGKYFTSNGYKLALSDTAVLYASATANIKLDYNMTSSLQIDAASVTAKATSEGSTGYVSSMDRNAYPDDDDVGNNHYTYIGIPLDKLPIAARVATGYYIGTNSSETTAGTKNRVDITVGFKPKFAYITTDGAYAYDDDNSQPYPFLVWIEGLTRTITYQWNGATTVWFEASADTFSHRAVISGGGRYGTYNAANTKYHYVIIG